MPPLHIVLAAVVVVGGFWALARFGSKRPNKRPGYIDLRTRFGHGINHPTFREARRGLREARRMRRNHY